MHMHAHTHTHGHPHTLHTHTHTQDGEIVKAKVYMSEMRIRAWRQVGNDRWTRAVAEAMSEIAELLRWLVAWTSCFPRTKGRGTGEGERLVTFSRFWWNSPGMLGQPIKQPQSCKRHSYASTAFTQLYTYCSLFRDIVLSRYRAGLRRHKNEINYIPAFHRNLVKVTRRSPRMAS